MLQDEVTNFNDLLKFNFEWNTLYSCELCESVCQRANRINGRKLRRIQICHGSESGWHRRLICVPLESLLLISIPTGLLLPPWVADCVKLNTSEAFVTTAEWAKCCVVGPEQSGDFRWSLSKVSHFVSSPHLPLAAAAAALNKKWARRKWSPKCLLCSDHWKLSGDTK